ncbi:MAG: LemA family protein, partial [Microbacteriaceae bacterium]|nr:LemA family protein [Microbacteriaceae bacterium]
MVNELDEMTGPTNSEGRDVNVVEKQLKPEVNTGTKVFEIA